MRSSNFIPAVYLRHHTRRYTYIHLSLWALLPFSPSLFPPMDACTDTYQAVSSNMPHSRSRCTLSQPFPRRTPLYMYIYTKNPKHIHSNSNLCSLIHQPTHSSSFKESLTDWMSQSLTHSRTASNWIPQNRSIYTAHKVQITATNTLHVCTNIYHGSPFSGPHPKCSSWTIHVEECWCSGYSGLPNNFNVSTYSRQEYRSLDMNGEITGRGRTATYLGLYAFDQIKAIGFQIHTPQVSNGSVHIILINKCGNQSICQLWPNGSQRWEIFRQSLVKVFIRIRPSTALIRHLYVWWITVHVYIYKSS